jgi:Tol biopolymer transport system component
LECCASWTPDEKYLVFTTLREGSGNIWAVRQKKPFWRKASRPFQLTAGPLQFLLPISSSDGKKLFVIGQQPRAELVRYSAKSNEFVPYLGGMSAGDLEYSRDGQWVTYVTYPDGALVRSRSDGSEKLQLTRPPMRAALAHWSPDGKHIAFTAAVEGKPWNIFMVSRDGGAPVRLGSENELELDPTWSPDGKFLAYGHSLREGLNLFIEVLDMETRKNSKLPNSEGFFAPRWSPDGASMAAIALHNEKLVLFDMKTKQRRDVASGVGLIGYITWAPDSKSLYFDTLYSGNPAYYKVRVSDGKLEKIADLKSLRTYSGQFGPGGWTGLGPDETPLFVRDIGTQEVYALDVDWP